MAETSSSTGILLLLQFLLLWFYSNFTSSIAQSTKLCLEASFISTKRRKNFQSAFPESPQTVIQHALIPPAPKQPLPWLPPIPLAPTWGCPGRCTSPNSPCHHAQRMLRGKSRKKMCISLLAPSNALQRSNSDPGRSVCFLTVSLSALLCKPAQPLSALMQILASIASCGKELPSLITHLKNHLLCSILHRTGSFPKPPSSQLFCHQLPCLHCPWFYRPF